VRSGKAFGSLNRLNVEIHAAARRPAELIEGIHAELVDSS
jgi:hypothetical protein